MNACSEAPQASSSTSSGGEIKQVAAAALPRIDATMSTREAFMMSNRQDGASADANREDSSAGGGGDGHRATSTASVEMTTNVSSAAPSAPSPAEPSHEELQQMQTHLLPAQQPMQQKQKQKQPHEPPSHPQQTSTGAAGSPRSHCHDWCRSYRRDAAWGGATQGLLPQYPTGLQERIMAFYQLRMAQAAHQAGEASQQRGRKASCRPSRASSQPMESASGAAGRHGGSLPVVTGEAGPQATVATRKQLKGRSGVHLRARTDTAKEWWADTAAVARAAGHRLPVRLAMRWTLCSSSFWRSGACCRCSNRRTNRRTNRRSKDKCNRASCSGTKPSPSAILPWKDGAV